jgi:TPR repeat protein
VELGSLSAASILADWCFEGNISRCERLDLARIELQASGGAVEAQVAAGRLRASGLDGNPDHVSARSWFQRAAEAGDAYSQAWMGDCCRMGLVDAPNAVTAESWYREAAAQDHLGAQIMLATLLSAAEARGVAELSEIFNLWLAAAQAGNAFAQRSLAECFASGWGCEVDAAAAVRWFQAAAGQGDAEAQYQLGRCYKKGLGVRKNAATARHWFELASSRGHQLAEAVMSTP